MFSDSIDELYPHLDKNIRIFLKWLAISQEDGKPFPSSFEQLLVNIDHSALLSRLLEGKPPLKEAPPAKFSYPWYSLIEKGYGSPFEVWEDKTKFPGFVGIDQTLWLIHEKTNDEDYIVRYSINIQKKQYSESKWHLTKKENKWLLEIVPEKES